jgi:O-acetyl-ADP-ribose deacetylase (regulator of RNase III)
MQLILATLHEPQAQAWQLFCGDLDFVRIHKGSILDVSCEALVSPANSFGFMDGGIDALYLRRFGDELQSRVRQQIAERHHGELLVGSAELVATHDLQIPFMIAAPTMRVPTILTDSVNVYLATRAALLCARQAGLDVVALPAMGTGVGRMSPAACAHQMRTAMDDVLLDRFTPPRTWAEASERHQALYTHRPRRLQLQGLAIDSPPSPQCAPR